LWGNRVVVWAVMRAPRRDVVAHLLQAHGGIVGRLHLADFLIEQFGALRGRILRNFGLRGIARSSSQLLKLRHVDLRKLNLELFELVDDLGNALFARFEVEKAVELALVLVL